MNEIKLIILGCCRRWPEIRMLKTHGNSRYQEYSNYGREKNRKPNGNVHSQL